MSNLNGTKPSASPVTAAAAAPAQDQAALAQAGLLIAAPVVVQAGRGRK